MAGHQDEHGHHPSYLKVYFILLFLFIISVLGPEMASVVFSEDQVLAKKILVLSTAFGIALVKAYYVVAYFMHLKFEKKIVNYMLMTTVVFMFLFFSGVSADVMKHEGSNWRNMAATAEVERALGEIEARKTATTASYANLVPVPAGFGAWEKVGHDKYRVPMDSAMNAVVKMSNSKNNPGATFFRGTGETPAEKSARKAHEAKLVVDYERLTSDAPAIDTPDSALVASGKAYFEKSQCVTCHSNDGSRLVGPSFKGLANRVFYGHVDGEKKKKVLTVRRADFAYFNESIENPAKVLVKGYPNQMPNITVSPDDRKALWAYIQSLSL